MELWKRRTQLYNSAEEKSPKVKTFPDLGLKKKRTKYKYFRKTLHSNCSSGHVECGFHIRA